ncbi:tetratricopeptide repeat protein [Texcoconibacillus texcoconensis]|uniref:Tetratricopeptide (TPR) repeat protein n=1 Tax=Texcoconibacillus texcoconensis TaxID=1095777 RepID=A0A840QNC4_9BACI|nr:hypothetical protein [Texcoconibacillus texcoconensis]MBB5172857.1 tetratricopeptide (TPR) repeat protein [Texcoconibacillus texcoconensis]
MKQQSRAHQKRATKRSTSISPYQEKLKAFQKAHPKDARQVFLLNKKARTLLQNQKYKSAVATIDQALALFPDYLPAIQTRMIISERTENEKQGLQDAEKALKLDSENVFTYIQKARILHRCRYEQKAKKTAEKAYNLYTKKTNKNAFVNYDLLQRIVHLYFLLGLNDELLSIYKTHFDYLSSKSLYRISLSQFNGGEITRAIEVLETIQEEAVRQQAIPLIEGMEIVRNDPALSSFSISPANKWGLNRLYALHSLLSKNERMQKQAVRFLLRDSSDWANTAIEKFLLSAELPEWIKWSLLEEYTTRNVHSEQVPIYMDGSKKFIPTFEHKKEFRKRHRVAKSKLKQGKFQEAVNEYQEMLHETPNNIFIEWWLAGAYRSEGYAEETEGSLLSVYEKMPSSLLRFPLGQLRVESGDDEAAKAWFAGVDSTQLRKKEALPFIHQYLRVLEKVDGPEASNRLFAYEQQYWGDVPEWGSLLEVRSQQESAATTTTTVVTEEPFVSPQNWNEKRPNFIEITSENEVLNLWTKDQLIRALKRLGVKGYSRLRKPELIDLILTEGFDANVLSEMESDERESFECWLQQKTVSQWDEWSESQCRLVNQYFRYKSGNGEWDADLTNFVKWIESGLLILGEKDGQWAIIRMID